MLVGGGVGLLPGPAVSPWSDWNALAEAAAEVDDVGAVAAVSTNVLKLKSPRSVPNPTQYELPWLVTHSQAAPPPYPSPAVP